MGLTISDVTEKLSSIPVRRRCKFRFQRPLLRCTTTTTINTTSTSTSTTPTPTPSPTPSSNAAKKVDEVEKSGVGIQGKFLTKY